MLDAFGAWTKRWPRLSAFVLGQLISLIVTGTGVFSEFLANDGIRLPTTQSTLNYVLLLGYLLHWLRSNGRKGNSVRWWVYALLALADVEANYLVVKAYQFTSIASVMLFDCLTIPFVMVLSRLLLGARYSTQHLGGAGLCVLGVSVLAGSDAAGISHTSADYPDAIKGDLLCILGAVCYAISNVGQEAIVKRHSRIEYLGMLGLFGTVINGAQLLFLEGHELSSTTWSNTSIACFGAFVVCLFLMYSLTPIFLQRCDAALFNLSLLTSDLWAVVMGVLLFSVHPGPLYILAFVTIVAGIVVYNRSPVETDPTTVVAQVLTGDDASGEERRGLADSVNGDGAGTADHRSVLAASESAVVVDVGSIPSVSTLRRSGSRSASPADGRSGSPT